MDTIILIAILIIAIVILTSINSKFQNLQETVYRLHEKINDLRNENQQLRQDLANIQKSNAQSTLVNKDLLKKNEKLHPIIYYINQYIIHWNTSIF